MEKFHLTENSSVAMRESQKSGGEPNGGAHLVGDASAVMPWKLVTLQTMPGIDRGHQGPHTWGATSVFIATLHLDYTDDKCGSSSRFRFSALRRPTDLSTAEVFARQTVRRDVGCGDQRMAERIH